MRAVLRLLMVLVVGTQLLGCAQFLGSLRRGVEDEPVESGTVGGRWAERGYFYQDRSPASVSPGSGEERVSWVSPDQQARTQRDTLRGGESYSQNPNVMPTGPKSYRNGFRATRADFVDEQPSEGSLWSSSGQTNYYLTKNKTRAIGDIVTINVEDALLKDIASEVKRGLMPVEQETELALAQEKLRRKTLGIKEEEQTAEGQATATRAPASVPPTAEPEEIEIPQATPADVNLVNALELKPGDPMMAEIVERYPNGNYRIRGIKRVLYKNGEPRLVTLVGIAKSSDISEEDVLNSGKIHEYRIEAHR